MKKAVCLMLVAVIAIMVCATALAALPTEAELKAKYKDSAVVKKILTYRKALRTAWADKNPKYGSMVSEAIIWAQAKGVSPADIIVVQSSASTIHPTASPSAYPTGW